MPLALDHEWEALVTLVLQNVLDVLAVSLERKSQIFANFGVSSSICYHNRALGLLRPETFLALVDEHVSLLKWIDKGESSLVSHSI